VEEVELNGKEQVEADRTKPSRTATGIVQLVVIINLLVIQSAECVKPLNQVEEVQVEEVELNGKEEVEVVEVDRAKPSRTATGIVQIVVIINLLVILSVDCVVPLNLSMPLA